MTRAGLTTEEIQTGRWIADALGIDPSLVAAGADPPDLILTLSDGLVGCEVTRLIDADLMGPRGRELSFFKQAHRQYQNPEGAVVSVSTIPRVPRDFEWRKGVPMRQMASELVSLVERSVATMEPGDSRRVELESDSLLGRVYASARVVMTAEDRARREYERRVLEFGNPENLSFEDLCGLTWMCSVTGLRCTESPLPASESIQKKGKMLPRWPAEVQSRWLALVYNAPGSGVTDIWLPDATTQRTLEREAQSAGFDRLLFVDLLDLASAIGPSSA